MSKPSFNKIVKLNQIINGRLNADSYDLEKLYRQLNKDNKKLFNKKDRQEQLIKLSIKRKNEIDFQIKRNSESIKKSFFSSIEKISLLYKKVGKIFYVKARFYWGGKQREVQVGSIPSILKIINILIKNKIILDLKLLKVNNMEWEQIKNKPYIFNGVKYIASLKAQEYILRKLLQKNNHTLFDDENRELDIKKSSSHNKFSEDQKYKKKKILIDSEIGNKDNWYDNWRKENL